MNGYPILAVSLGSFFLPYSSRMCPRAFDLGFLYKDLLFLLLLLFGTTTIKARRFFFSFLFLFLLSGRRGFIFSFATFKTFIVAHTHYTHTHIRSRYVSGNSFIPAHITSSPLRSRARKTAGRSSSTASKSLKKRTGISKGDASFFSAPAAPGGGGGIC